jgi:hypothetical protein
MGCATGSARPPTVVCVPRDGDGRCQRCGRSGRIVTKTRTVKDARRRCVGRCAVLVRSVRYPLIVGAGVVNHHPLPHAQIPSLAMYDS